MGQIGEDFKNDFHRQENDSRVRVQQPGIRARRVTLVTDSGTLPNGYSCNCKLVHSRCVSISGIATPLVFSHRLLPI